MHRRAFLQQAGLTLGALTSSAIGQPSPEAAPQQSRLSDEFNPQDWASVRAQFPLTTSYIHLATFLLASHPRPVAEAIERHRRGLDENTAAYWHDHFETIDMKQRAAAAEYMGGHPGNIALTDSTTMGLGLIYSSLHLEPGQEILTTTHDHYSTLMALKHRADRTGAKVRQVPLYEDPFGVSLNEVVSRMRQAITDNTSVLAVTWVHSCTGVKLPLAAMAEVLREINAQRAEKDRILFCVDGVHGFGIEDVTIDELGCDFFMAGTHKWIFGPRGTGVIWGTPQAWQNARPLVPSFGLNYLVWLGALTPNMVPVGDLMTPGGFHSFEHRWALGEAFRFHQQIGKARIAQRIHRLNSQAKQAMLKMPHLTLHTPAGSELSSGIICFEVEGLAPQAVVEKLKQRGIIASSSPYRISYARIAPSLINNEEEIERTMRELRALA